MKILYVVHVKTKSMAFLLRFAAPALNAVGLGGSVGRGISSVAKGITDPLIHAASGIFKMGTSMLGGIGGAARTIGGAVMTPFKILQSPIIWVGGAALVIYLLTNR